jgi:tRNA threonylcarbamoyladenosine biosynthesis protein TsaE
MKLEHISKSLKDTEKIVQSLYSKLYNKVNLLIGDLGSGKTTFVRFFAKTSGIKTTVTSPTFNILQTYNCKDTTIYHFDLYRLESSLELEEIGFYEFTKGNNTIFIEWADKFNIENIFTRYNKISFYIIEENKRKIMVDIKNGNS